MVPRTCAPRRIGCPTRPTCPAGRHRRRRRVAGRQPGLAGRRRPAAGQVRLRCLAVSLDYRGPARRTARLMKQAGAATRSGWRPARGPVALRTLTIDRRTVGPREQTSVDRCAHGTEIARRRRGRERAWWTGCARAVAILTVPMRADSIVFGIAGVLVRRDRRLGAWQPAGRRHCRSAAAGRAVGSRPAGQAAGDSRPRRSIRSASRRSTARPTESQGRRNRACSWATCTSTPSRSPRRSLVRSRR